MNPEKFEEILFGELLKAKDKFIPIRQLLIDNNIINKTEAEIIRLYVEELQSQNLIKVESNPFGNIYTWRLKFGRLINYFGMRRVNAKGRVAAHKILLMAATAYNLKKLLLYSDRPKAQGNILTLKESKSNYFILS